MNRQDYDRLAEIVFRLDAVGKPTYPGYRPEVLELPNGDGQVDAQKRYAHVACKYLWSTDPKLADEFSPLGTAMAGAYRLAMRVARALEVPSDFLPKYKYGALRILEYPVGATSALHKDFDLFTLMIYRDQPECFVSHDKEIEWAPDAVTYHDRFNAARKLNAQLHIGELGELIGLGPATPHEVVASDRPQHAIVYFAIPDHDAELPAHAQNQDRDIWTVGDWLAERMARSRTYK